MIDTLSGRSQPGSSQVTSESRFLSSDDPAGEPLLVEPRRHGIEYAIDHQDDRFLILTNDGAENFRLMAAPVSSPGRESWTEVVPERPGVRLNFTDPFVNHVVLGERSDGLQRLEVLDTATGDLHLVARECDLDLSPARSGAACRDRG